MAVKRRLAAWLYIIRPGARRRSHKLGVSKLIRLGQYLDQGSSKLRGSFMQNLATS